MEFGLQRRAVITMMYRTSSRYSASTCKRKDNSVDIPMGPHTVFNYKFQMRILPLGRSIEDFGLVLGRQQFLNKCIWNPGE
ncbi:hypothetical protein BDN70DRAFT_872863 [Pholiota conissans]|uniref:Uncharacterized protein n=1 Tax=Pholiota conissans TaxID=109636 RepID=A0A9P6D5M6_9AGAR|nr:hypothetical protein BDN70DRAFT_872863 [Pholiota conissans]